MTAWFTHRTLNPEVWPDPSSASDRAATSEFLCGLCALCGEPQSGRSETTDPAQKPG